MRSYRKATGHTHEQLWQPSYCVDAAIHFGAEIIVRTIGPFQQGYLFDGLSIDTPILQGAIQYAAQCIREPELLDSPENLLVPQTESKKTA